jgi:hypothetical protein
MTRLERFSSDMEARAPTVANCKAEDSRTTGPGSVRRRRRRTFLAGLLLLPVLLYLLREPLLYPLLLRAASVAAHRWKGFDLRVERMSGNGFGRISLEGVRLRAREPEEALRSLDAERVETEHSLWRLVLGKEGGLRAVRASGVDLVIDDTGETRPSAPREPLRLPDPLPRLSLERVSLRASLRKGRRLEVPRAELRSVGDAFEVRASGVRFEDPNLGPLRANLEGRIVIEEGALHGDGLEIARGANAATIESFAFPLEDLDSDRLLATARARFRLEWKDLPSLAGRIVPPERRLPHRLVVEGDLSEGQARIERGLLETSGGTLRVVAGSIRAPGTGEGRDLAVDLDLEADFHDLAPVGAALGEAPWRGSLKGAVEVSGTLRRPTGRAHLEGKGVTIEGIGIGDLVALGDLDASALRVERLEARGEGAAVTLAGVYSMSEERLEDLALDARVLDLAKCAPGLESFAGVGGRISLEAEGRLARDVSRLEVSRLDLESGGETLGLEAPVTVAWSPEGLALESLALSGTFGELRASAMPAEGGTRVRAAIEAAKPSSILRSILPEGAAIGRLRAEVDGVIGSERLSIAGSVEAGDLRHPSLARSLDVECAATVDEGVAVLEALRVRSGEEIVAEFEGRGPLDLRGPEVFPEGEVALRGTARLSRIEDLPFSGRMRLSGSGSLLVDLRGSWRDLRGRLNVSGEGLALEEPGGEFPRLVGPASLALDLAVGDGWAVEGFRIEAPGQLEATAAGRVDLGGDVLALAEGGLPSFLDAPLHVEGRFEISDLSWVGRRTSALRRLGGSLRAQAALEGTLGRPRLSGSSQLEGGEVRLAAEFPLLEGLEGSLRFAGGLARVESMRGELGGSPFLLEGTIGNLFGVPQLDLRLAGENLLLHRSREARVRADADLRIGGPLDALHVAGEAVLRGGRLAKNVEILADPRRRSPAAARRGFQIFSLRDPLLDDATFDVRVRAAEPFEIRNNVADGAVRPDLRLTGTGKVPIVAGVVYVDETKVSLPATRLTVTSGTIRFEEGDPFVPVLDLNAEARIRGYEAAIQVTGPYDRPEVLLSSTPPLPHRDLLLLVLTGKPPEEPVSARTGERAAQAVTVFLAQDFLGRWLGGESVESEESVLERFEVHAGEVATRSGESSMEGTFRLTRGVLFEKDTLYLAAEQDEYGQYNFGVRIVVRFR